MTPTPFSSVNTVSGTWLLLLVLVSCFYVLLYEAEAADDYNLMKIGAIIDVNSRSGKEEKVAMEIAVKNYNKISQNYKLSLYIRDSGRDPQQAVSAAEWLIKEKEVMTVIIGMETWGDAVLVADIGSRAKVPVISFAEPAITPPLTPYRWPFLVRMANNRAEQIKCIAALTGSYNWRRVIVIYEDDAISADTGDLALLSEALQKLSSEIEYRLALPPFSYLTNPEAFVRNELQKIAAVTQSRVFIILQSSLPMSIHLFREGKKMGIVGTDSVWIITETVTSFLHSFNASVISSMQGALGIKTYLSEYTSSYKYFKARFKKKFQDEYPEEDGSDPGFYALRAYDTIQTVSQGLDRMTSDNISSEVLLENILSSNFTGLSGETSFGGGKLSHTPALSIINVQLGHKEKELYIWLPNFGFSKSLQIENGAREENSSQVGGDVKDLAGAVIWPGNLSQRDPKGWTMPTKAKPLKIGVPARTSFDKFVKVKMSIEPNEIPVIDGFCIQLFYKVKGSLDYALPYTFFPYNGTYDDLVYHVYNKTYDAIVGDVTILADRSNLVEFTQPYAESGLSMIVPVYSQEAAWILVKPFTLEMWLVTAAILIYTIFVVWFLEHRQNPEFGGPWNDQIATAIWFTFSSLFFAHRERVYSNLTRLVVVVWLFVVLILNSSYTANLSSILTVRRLKPKVTDIDWLKRTEQKIGCDGDSFVRNYLTDVLKFESKNILNVSSQYDYGDEFESHNISAAFLELPYEKVFIGHFCKGYSATTPTYRFGGLGFVFQKGSPLTADFSKAILKLSENGELKSLEEQWLAPTAECLVNMTSISNDRTERLSLRSFQSLYLISSATSTICFLTSLFQLFKNYIISSMRSFCDKAVRLAKYIYNRIKERQIF